MRPNHKNMMRQQDARQDMSKGAATGGMGDLFAGLNHDVRTSMNGVTGMLALLLDSGLTDAQRQLASQALRCAGDLMALFDADAASPCAARRQDAPPFLAAPFLAGRRILVVDDNSVNRTVAQRLAENLGCAVEAAADGEQAVAMHAAHPYHLILMDCQMPRMDGYQATQRIRALDGAAGRVPVIAVTACAAPEERERCLCAGMDDFVAKPLRPGDLEDALARWLPASAPVHCAPAACADELDLVRDMFGADFAELARLYSSDGAPRIEAMRRAGAAGDCAQAAKFAHALAGSSVSIGATGLSVLCKELELRAKAGELDDFGARLADIEAEYGRVCGKLQAMLGAPGLESFDNGMTLKRQG